MDRDGQHDWDETARLAEIVSGKVWNEIHVFPFADSLDAGWAEAEAALPNLTHLRLEGKPGSYIAQEIDFDGHDWHRGIGSTTAAAPPRPRREAPRGAAVIRKEEITFYDPKPTASVLCRIGVHRPTILASEGPIEHGLSYVWRWTCPCQRFYWLNDREALRDGLGFHGGVKFANR